MKLIWRLLRQHISVLQLAGFFLANLIGLSIILCGVQIYNDLKPAISGENSILPNDYLVVSKMVTTDKMLTPQATRFSKEEIAKLANQPFVKRLGEFRSSQFKVQASIPLQGPKPIYTMMFFESVPDSFIDVKSDKWHFKPGDTTIPIIIPRAYLNLYNFGFSPSMGGWQVSEEVLGGVPITIDIVENKSSVARYTAQIVGYSERVNTILVPESFLVWANEKYGNTSAAELNSMEELGVSRLIFEATDPSADTAVIGEYLEQHGYYAENNDDDRNKMNYLLIVALVVIVVIGSIFSLLSLAILTLSIYLLLQKNTTKLENLVLAGYAPHQVAAPYQLLTLVLNLAVVVGAFGVVFILRHHYLEALARVFDGDFNGSIANTFIIGGVIAIVVILFNMFIIQRKINEISRKRS